MASYIINLDSRSLRAALNSSDGTTRTQAMAVLEETKKRLAQLHEHRNRITFAHIELLDLYDINTPNSDLATAITGAITSGSINVDGSSAIRKTCNLSLIVKDEIVFSDYYWTMNSKFQIWIGLENMPNIDFFEIDNITSYPDLITRVQSNSNQSALGDNIIWLNQGQFIINSFSAQQTTNNWTVNLSGKDLMCRLNGDIGGTFVAEETLNYFEDDYSFDGNLELDLGQTIQNVVKRFCPKCIIDVSDVYNEEGDELYRYSGDAPMYAFLTTEDSTTSLAGFTVYGEQPVYINGSSETVAVSDCTSGQSIKFTPSDEKAYTLRTIEYGESIGEKKIKLMYPGKLTAKSGDTATGMLDRIKQCFTGFEYYFDTNGDFIFRKKRGYVDLAGTSTVEYSTTEYTFEDASLLTSMSISPTLADFKNDYVVWGTKKSSNGIESNILMHYAFDEKPSQYYMLRKASTYDNLFNENIQKILQDYNDTGIVTETLTAGMTSYTTQDYDWRELLYQMAEDSNYFASMREQINKDPNATTEQKEVLLTFIEKWSDANWYSKQYEAYFPELRYYWRRLYNPEATQHYDLTSWSYEPKAEESLHRTQLLEAKDTDTYNFNDYYYRGGDNRLYHLSSYGSLLDYNDLLYSTKPYDEFDEDDELISLFAEALQKNSQPKNIYYNGQDFIKWFQNRTAADFVDTNLFVYEFVSMFDTNGLRLAQNVGGSLLQSVKLIAEDDSWETVRYPVIDIKAEQEETRRIYLIEGATNYFYLDNDPNTHIIDLATLHANLNSTKLKYKYDNNDYSIRSEDVAVPSAELYYKTITPELLDDNKRAEVYQKAVLKINLKALKEALPLFETLGGSINEDWINKQLKKYRDGFMPFVHWWFDATCGSTERKYGYLQTGQLKEDKTLEYQSYWANYNETWRAQKYLYTTEGINIWETKWAELNTKNENNQKNLFRMSKDPSEYLAATDETSKPLYEIVYQTDITGEATNNYSHNYYDYYVYTIDYLKEPIDITQKYFNRAYLEDRINAQYWLEFLDPNEMTYLPEGKWHWEKLIPAKAGRRVKISNNDKINALWLPESHELILNDLTETAQELLTQLTIGKTAEDEIYELLYNHSYATEAISLTSIPLYFLSPNTIIRLGDKLRGHNNQRSIVVAGDYVLTKFSIPLTYNGTSSLSLTRKPTAEWFPLNLNGKYRRADVEDETLYLLTDKEGIYTLSIDNGIIEIIKEEEE